MGLHTVREFSGAKLNSIIIFFVVIIYFTISVLRCAYSCPCLNNNKSYLFYYAIFFFAERLE